MNTEIWVTISFCPYYEVSNLGRVRSIDRDIPNPKNLKFTRHLKGKVLALQDVKGYLCVHLSRHFQNQRVNRLVATHFIANPNNYPEVNHKDGNKKNNYVSNLEWCTHKENLHHAREIGLWERPKKGQGSRLGIEDVVQIKNLIREGLTNSQVSRLFSVDPSTISKIKTGDRW